LFKNVRLTGYQTVLHFVFTEAYDAPQTP